VLSKFRSEHLGDTENREEVNWTAVKSPSRQ
jgi:hypothetical protein